MSDRTELGAARITPVIARRTEKHLAQAAAKRVERWRRITLEASKQSRRTDVRSDRTGCSAHYACDRSPHGEASRAGCGEACRALAADHARSIEAIASYRCPIGPNWVQRALRL